MDWAKSVWSKVTGSKPVTAAKGAAQAFANGVTSRVGALLPGGGQRLDYPPPFRDLLAKIGSKLVGQVSVARTPMAGGVQKALNVITVGKWEAGKSEIPYDDVYHLLMILTIDGVQYALDKKAVLELEPFNNAMKTVTGFSELSVPVLKTVPLSDFLANGVHEMGMSNYFTYDPFTNNCQYYINGVMNGNTKAGVVTYTPEAQQFVMQNVQQLTSKLSSGVQGLMKGVTNFAHRANILMYGKGFSPKDTLHLHHYANDPSDDRTDKLSEGGAKLLHHMIKHMHRISQKMIQPMDYLTSAETTADLKKRIKEVDAAGGIPNESGQTYTVSELLRGLFQHPDSPKGELDFADYKGMLDDQHAQGVSSNIPIVAHIVSGPKDKGEYGMLTQPQKDMLYTMHTVADATNGKEDKGKRTVSSMISPFKQPLKLDFEWAHGVAPPTMVVQPDTSKISPSGRYVHLEKYLKDEGIGRDFLFRGAHAIKSGLTLHEASGKDLTTEPRGGGLNDAVMSGGGFWDTISDGLSSAWNGVKSVASDVWDGVKSVASNVWDGAKEVAHEAAPVLMHTVQGLMGEGGEGGEDGEGGGPNLLPLLEMGAFLL
jgi:hypothetical protein